MSIDCDKVLGNQERCIVNRLKELNCRIGIRSHTGTIDSRHIECCSLVGHKRGQIDSKRFESITFCNRSKKNFILCATLRALVGMRLCVQECIHKLVSRTKDGLVVFDLLNVATVCGCHKESAFGNTCRQSHHTNDEFELSCDSGGRMSYAQRHICRIRALRGPLTNQCAIRPSYLCQCCTEIALRWCPRRALGCLWNFCKQQRIRNRCGLDLVVRGHREKRGCVLQLDIRRSQIHSLCRADIRN